MTGTSMTGTNWSLNGEVIDFFGRTGRRHGQGWLMGFRSEGAPIFPQDPEPQAGAIQGIFESDERAGQGHRIKLLLASPSHGVMLVLDGTIGRPHLRRAREGRASGLDYVDIPGVVVAGRTITVRVIPQDGLGLATADARGQII